MVQARLAGVTGWVGRQGRRSFRPRLRAVPRAGGGVRPGRPGHGAVGSRRRGARIPPWALRGGPGLRAGSLVRGAAARAGCCPARRRAAGGRGRGPLAGARAGPRRRGRADRPRQRAAPGRGSRGGPPDVPGGAPGRSVVSPGAQLPRRRWSHSAVEAASWPTGRRWAQSQVSGGPEQPRHGAPEAGASAAATCCAGGHVDPTYLRAGSTWGGVVDLDRWADAETAFRLAVGLDEGAADAQEGLGTALAGRAW